MPDSSALILWKKLLPSPISSNSKDPLLCEVHDPLWLLARQWQMGEFNAQDAGMAAYAHIIAQSSTLQARRGKNAIDPVLHYNVQEQPLNAAIESIASPFDLTLRIEAGRKWQKLLIAANKPDAYNAFRQNLLLQFKTTAYTYETASNVNASFTTETYQQTLAAVANGRTVDGELLYKELQARKASDFLQAPDAIVDDTGTKWLQWLGVKLGASLSQPSAGWDSERLEYRASAAAAMPANAALCLQMPEYDGASMDSYSWEVAAGDAALKTGLDPAQIHTYRKTLMPLSVSYPSMPRTRWWEFEDTVLDLSNAQANKTDLGLLLLSEFGLKYSNDWLMMPLSLSCGDLVSVRNIRVTDVFGVQTIIKPSQQDINWNLFQLSAQAIPVPGTGILLPPVSAHYLQSEKLEEVCFIRDEMANMAWGVETTVQDGLGNGIDGKADSVRFETWLRALSENTAPHPANNAAVQADFKYAIGTTVPANWIPFVPWRVLAGAPIVFRRGAMPRLLDTMAPTRIRPRTDILINAANTQRHYDIQEAEIPATGIFIKQEWRRARWMDGSVVTWLARKKTAGRIAESSGLQFDQIR